MDYIAVIDFEHLDNGMFLSAFAQALSSHKKGSGIIIHGDSSYTDRLMQTGMMREDACKRAVKDLNHRLIALLADNGVAAIGLNAFQRELVTENDGKLQVKRRQLENLPPVPCLLLSNLIIRDGNETGPLPLADFANLLQQKLDIKEILVFSLDDTDELFEQKPLPDGPESNQLSTLKSKLPKEFREASFSFRLTTTGAFSRFPDISDTTLVNADSETG